MVSYLIYMNALNHLQACLFKTDFFFLQLALWWCLMEGQNLSILIQKLLASPQEFCYSKNSAIVMRLYYLYGNGSYFIDLSRSVIIIFLVIKIHVLITCLACLHGFNSLFTWWISVLESYLLSDYCSFRLKYCMGCLKNNGQE